jgi:hypothetical protein
VPDKVARNRYKTLIWIFFGNDDAFVLFITTEEADRIFYLTVPGLSFNIHIDHETG